MRILHYFLGLPPHRTGGLTQYAIDLMLAEKELGHHVALLYPGNVSLCPHNNRSSFKYKGIYKGIDVFQLTNGLPVPLFYGIKSVQDFIAPRILCSFDAFMGRVQPDIFHVHTLMGLPIELMQLMKESGVKVVFTSHDYYGLCPRVNFIDYQGGVCESSAGSICEKCCGRAWPTWLLCMRNSEFIVPLKKFVH